MQVFKIARFEVRADAVEAAERAMREFAAYVGRELADSSWVTYRDPTSPTHYVSLIRADNEAAEQRHRNGAGTKRFVEVLYPLVVGRVSFTDYDLVASSV